MSTLKIPARKLKDAKKISNRARSKQQHFTHNVQLSPKFFLITHITLTPLTMARTKAPAADDLRFGANLRKVATIEHHFSTMEGLQKQHEALVAIRREEERRIDGMSNEELIAYSRESDLAENLTAPADLKVKTRRIPKQLDIIEQVKKRRDMVKEKAGIFVESVTEQVNTTLTEMLTDSMTEISKLKSKVKEERKFHFGSLFEANGKEEDLNDEVETPDDQRIQLAISKISATFSEKDW